MKYSEIERNAIRLINDLEIKKNLSEDELNILKSKDQIKAAINYLYNDNKDPIQDFYDKIKELKNK